MHTDELIEATLTDLAEALHTPANATAAITRAQARLLTAHHEWLTWLEAKAEAESLSWATLRELNSTPELIEARPR